MFSDFSFYAVLAVIVALIFYVLYFVAHNEDALYHKVTPQAVSTSLRS